MTVWRLQKNTDGGDIAQYCIDNHVIAMGWSLKETSSENRQNINSFEDYCEYAKNEYKRFDNIRRLSQELAVDDLVWLRSNGRYYIGRVEANSRWRFCNDEEAQKLDASNQVTNIYWYLASENADEDSVPGAITTAFIGGATFQRIHKEEINLYSRMIYNEVQKNTETPFVYPINALDVNVNTFFSFLQTDDAEDLLCMWLYKTRGYICIPSTNKKSTQRYECVLLNPKNGDHIYIQAKKGKIDIDAKEYGSLNGKTYLLTTEGKVNNASECKNVVVVSPSVLYDFAMDRENKNLLSESISRWVAFLKKYGSKKDDK